VQGPEELHARSARRGDRRKKLTARLVWELRGKREWSSIEAGLLKRGAAPDWYVDKPPISEQDRFYLAAFQRLTTTRDNGFGLGPIPWDKIVDYAAIKQLSPQNTDLFCEVISSMDDAFLTWSAQAREEDRKDATTAAAAANAPRSVNRG
jgi:hypothetical protein